MSIPRGRSLRVHFRLQMYEVEDPNLYLSSASTRGKELQYVHHLKKDFTLIAFKESENLRIVAPRRIEKICHRISKMPN